MQTREAVKLLGGSIAVYVIMAACSAADNGSTQGFGTMADGGQQSGSSGGGSGGSGITNPVPKANADVSGSRLKANYVGGADGSKQYTLSFHDTQRNEDCYFRSAADGTMRCVPSAGAVTLGYFSDAQCTQPIGFVSKGCTAKYVTTTSTMGTCDSATSVTHLFNIGAPLASGTSAFAKSGTSCTSATASLSSLALSYDSYTLGAEVSPSSFVQGTPGSDP
jgi:hypothetical protein